MPESLEERCAICPELLADGYGKCDHRRCMECVRLERELSRTAWSWVTENHASPS